MRRFEGLRARLARARAAIIFTVALVAALLVPGGATGASESATFPFGFSEPNPCFPADGLVVETGEVHLLVSGTLSGSGMAQSHIEANLQGVQAVSVTGHKYVVVNTSSDKFELSADLLDPLPFHHSFEWTVQFVRVGEDGSIVAGDDYYQHVVAHTTINPNGTVTVDDFTFDTRCQ